MLFEEWKALYGQVADLSAEQLKGINDTLSFAHATNVTQVPVRLFVVHTYNSLLSKLLAAEVIVAHGLASAQSFAIDLAAEVDDQRLLKRLQTDIERGQLFEAVGIYGFVEEVNFSWYIDVPDMDGNRASVCSAIREILSQLSLYRTDNLDHYRDVLRDFYQDLVPELLRKTLGEFYTPDWLVSYTADVAGVEDWSTVRTLDPTCGSGSFLVEIISRKRQAACDLALSPEATVREIVDSVWGFDLNPLAVQIARTNFVMAIADLLKAAPGQHIEIPILLADAVYSPAPLPQSDDQYIEYRIGSQIADLHFKLPRELAFDRDTLDRVFDVMAEFVEGNAYFRDCAKALKGRRILDDKQIRMWIMPLRRTYDQVLNLHRQQRNGIWFSMVRNYFWSATAGDFDLIIGNPPWVRCSKLPTNYRDRVKPTCEQYEIFSDTPHHGGNELDISGMITYTTADKWLKQGGTLACIITQTHFQTPSSQGFRRFRIDRDNYLIPVTVDDLKALRPFPEAANKTSVAIFRKTIVPPEYPVKYSIWTAAGRATRAIPTQSTHSQVMERVDVSTYEANPVAGPGSPWAILPPGRFGEFASIRGHSEWIQGRKGITADLNAVYFVRIEATDYNSELVQISTRPEAGRTDIGTSRTFWVEPDFLYPLVKGAADFDICFLNPRDELFAFVPNHGITSSAFCQAEEQMNTFCPKTKSYFEFYEMWLRNRSTWKNRTPKSPFYSIYNVGDYTFSPYKVIWAEQSGTFKSAVATSAEHSVLGERPYVPDHKIFFVDFHEAEPAFFLCGLLSASIVREFIESHNISIQVGNIFKHMRLPTYDVTQSNHVHLSELVELAHNEKDPAVRSELVDRIGREAERVIASFF